MKDLRATVKRNLSLFSVQAWQQGYGKYLKEYLEWPYPVYFYYDGEKVNFYHTLADFNYFKQVVTAQLIGDQRLFDQWSVRFRDNVARLKKLAPTDNTLPEIFALIGRIMSFYVFIVSDYFVKQVPKAWELRLLSEGILYEKDADVEAYVKNLLSKNDLDENLAHVMSVEEILDLVDHKPISADRIQSRRRGYIIENETLLEQNDFEEFCRAKDLVKPEEISREDSKTVKGQIAYPGKVRGRALIIKKEADAGRIAADSVVVCIMTNATYTPALAKARAIVTDEGGITCHAAIIARELKKPCITGTKIATQFIKDGDLIEVDADKGVINVLNNNCLAVR